MGQQELYDRILRSLYDAAFDEAGWPGTAALIDAACGIKGNALILVDGRSPRDSQLHFARSAIGDNAARTWSGSISTNTGPGTSARRA